MNIASFFEHWSIVENPFTAEEARHDSVFARLGQGPTNHPDFEKILGDPSRPSTAIVFGEKGSGKTAIRLTMGRRLDEYNAAHPGERLFVVAHDDLNPMLDRLFAVVRVKNKTDDKEGVLKVLQRLTLSDHMDALLHAAVSSLMDQLLADAPKDKPEEAKALRQLLKKLDNQTKRDLILLQVVYDRETGSDARRTASLRRRLRGSFNWHPLLWRTLALLGWLPLAGVIAASFFVDRQVVAPQVWIYATGAAGLFWLILLVKHVIWDRWRMSRLARRLMKSVRAIPRTTEALAAALDMVHPGIRSHGELPLDDSEEIRYAMFARLKRVLKPLGYSGIVVIIDRVDEPTLVSGDPDRMKAVIWPMLHNKFLQQPGVGIKMLLPIELRHELFRESQAFFQEARLDKQNMVERLNWSGVTLYDLCNARLRACIAQNGATPAGTAERATALADLFEEEVGRQDVIDALEQMHQPRDAFKFLYQCIAEHCANVTQDHPRFKISRDILDMVRKQQAERVQMVYRGVRPA